METALPSNDLQQLIVVCQGIEAKIDALEDLFVVVNQKIDDLNKKITEATTS